MKIVFDFAGVVFHWQPTVMLQTVLPHHATDEPSTDRLMTALFQSWGGDWAEFDRGTVEPAVLIDRIARRTGLPPADVQAAVQAIPLALQPDPATVALIHRLRAVRRGVYFLSNMPAPYADHLETAHACNTWFDDGVFSARVHAIKPEPEIFELAARRFGGLPQEFVFLDDVPANVAAAKEAGWQALHFTSADAAEAALHQNGWWPKPP
jgi:putative hydrolase of the HAD superfamily